MCIKISLEANISKQILKATISKCLFLDGRILSILFFVRVYFPRSYTKHVLY